MTLNKDELTGQQLDAVLCLRDGMTKKDTAEKIGIHRKTVERWSQQPVFAKAIAEGTKLAQADLNTAHTRVVEEILRLSEQKPLNAKKMKEVLGVKSSLGRLLEPATGRTRGDRPLVTLELRGVTEEEVKANPTLRELLLTRMARESRDEAKVGADTCAE